jgi:hypothetical protein
MNWKLPLLMFALFPLHVAEARAESVGGEGQVALSGVDYAVPEAVLPSAYEISRPGNAEVTGRWIGENLSWRHRLASYYAVMFGRWLSPVYVTAGFCDGSAARFRYAGVRLGASPLLILDYMSGTRLEPGGHVIPEDVEDARQFSAHFGDPGNALMMLAHLQDNFAFQSDSGIQCQQRPEGQGVRVACWYHEDM